MSIKQSQIYKSLLVLMLITCVSMATENKSFVKMGYGWSINENEANAVSEAAEMMFKQIDKPDFVGT